MKLLFAVLAISLSCVAAKAQLAKAVAEDVRSSEKVVKGAPFTANAITESVQTLADGNQISRSSTSKLYRDSEGRYRRDDNPKQLGVPGANIEVPESIVIIDPVTGMKYTLNAKERTFRESVFKASKNIFKDQEKNKKDQEKEGKDQEQRLERQKEDLEKQQKTATEGPKKPEEKRPEDFEKRKEERAEHLGERLENQAKRRAARADRAEHTAERSATAESRIELNGRIEFDSRVDVSGRSPENGPGLVATKESLGTRVIEGVPAEGTRMTTTIPAGTIGNSREISVIYEKWYSNDLMMTVQSVHRDPRFGEQTYRLTNISRTEPPGSVFVPPADYTKVSGKPKPPAGIKEPSINIKAPNISVKPLTPNTSKPSAKPLPPNSPKPKKMFLKSDGNTVTLLK